MFVIPLLVSLTSVLCYFHVSGCGKCAEKPVFTPSRLVVEHGDSTSATCSVCQSCADIKFGLENSVGESNQNGTIITWTVDRMTEWSTEPICYYLPNVNGQCCSTLNVTVYKPPDSVSFSFTNHSHMYEANEYTLQCDVRNVAPVENLFVTFYRGQTKLAQQQSTSPPEAVPKSEVFNVSIKARREDDGAQFWCEAKLELGPDGPRRPPVLASQNITATVYYKPHLERSSHPEPIVVTEGESLQLNCSAEGNPSPSYTWRLPVSRLSMGTPLIINPVTAKDEGLYVCLIRNDVGTVNLTFNVTVKGLLTSTSLPPTTTTTASTTAAATATAATTTQTHIIKRPDAPDSSSSITATCWYTTWFMIFFPLVI